MTHPAVTLPFSLYLFMPGLYKLSLQVVLCGRLGWACVFGGGGEEWNAELGGVLLSNNQSINQSNK
jgi:hypothetical protein